MKTLALLSVFSFLGSCATKLPEFRPAKVCSAEALRYLKNPRNRTKSRRVNADLAREMASTQKNMQLCYEDYRLRSGHIEFNTCLVVGVDRSGAMDFYNFSSREVRLDQSFLNCAQAVTRSVPYAKFGKNFILIQAYQFYIN